MSRLGPIVRAIGVAAGSGVLIFGAAVAPAHATNTYTYSIATPESNPQDGSAHATGAVIFTGKRHFRVESSVWDSCPADGRGAYLDVIMKYKDGSVGGWQVNRDVNGCDNGLHDAVSYFNTKKRVMWVQMVVIEQDASLSGFSQRKYSTKKDNPYTSW